MTIPRPGSRFTGASAAMLLAGLLTGGGCRAVLGIEEREAAPAPVDAGTGVFAAFPEACHGCFSENCGTAVEACNADPGCADGYTCVAGVFQPARYEQCTATIPSESWLQALMVGNCALDHCGLDCLGDPWACVGQYRWALPTTETAVFRARLLGYTRPVPLVGLTVTVCDRRDAPCATPLLTATSDELGWVELEVPLVQRANFGVGEDGFDGYFHVRGAGVDQLRFRDAPIAFDYTNDYLIPTRAELEALVAPSGRTLLPGRSMLHVETRDCFTQRRAGLRFLVDTADATAEPYFLSNGGLGSFTATETTDGGSGGYVNLPPGQATVRVMVAATGQEVSSTTVFLRADSWTSVVMYPAR